MNDLKRFLLPTQTKLFNILCSNYKHDAVYDKKKYILVKGNAPVLLVAHLDTVHKEPVRNILTDGNLLMSPQGIGGDDRCGVYALTQVYERAGVKPWLLFTCDEETGGVGANAFADAYEKGDLPDELSDIKFIIEIDRRGSREAVYYDCGNIEFEEYIQSKGFRTELGSYSDISTIAPAMGIAAANLGSGYYNAHTKHEYINYSELQDVVEAVIDIVNESIQEHIPRFEYVDIWEEWGGYSEYDPDLLWDDDPWVKDGKIINIKDLMF